MRVQVSFTPRVMPAALASPHIDRAYYKCWTGLRSHFWRDAPHVNGAANGSAAAAKGNTGIGLAAAPPGARQPEEDDKVLATAAQER